MGEILKTYVLWLERQAMRLAAILHNVNMWIVLPLLIMVVTTDVVLRYGFRSSIQGATEISGLLLLLVFFLSLPLCTLRYGHVYMELAYARMRGGMRRIADLIATLSGAVFMAFFSWQALEVFRDAVKYEERGMLIEIPYWPFAGAVFICGVIAALAFAIQILKLLVGLDIDREEYVDE